MRYWTNAPKEGAMPNDGPASARATHPLSQDARLNRLGRTLQSCYSTGSFNQEIERLITILDVMPAAVGQRPGGGSGQPDDA
jgi:hypothetical protein